MKYGKIRIEDGFLVFTRHMMINNLPCKDIVWAYMRKEGADEGDDRQLSVNYLVIVTRRKKRYKFDMTEKEIHENLEDELHELARRQKMTYDEVCKELKECYDGYHFVEDSIGLYNPFSLLNTFDKMKFGSYWFETGTPTYLIELLKQNHYSLQRIAHEETDADVLNSIDSASQNPVPVIYQSGYLTIKGYDRRFGMYRLGFPNREVEEGFIKFLLPMLM